jgi:hypothetical protein
MSEYGAVVEWYWQGNPEGPRGKPVPVPLCPPQIPRGLPREQTRVSAVRSRQLTFCAAMAQAVSRRGGPGSRPDQSMFDLWWTKCHWGRFFSESFGFPPARFEILTAVNMSVLVFRVSNTMLVTTYKTTRRYNPEDHDRHHTCVFLVLFALWYIILAARILTLCSDIWCWCSLCYTPYSYFIFLLYNYVIMFHSPSENSRMFLLKCIFRIWNMFLRITLHKLDCC